MLWVIVSNGKTNPFILPSSWLMEALLAAVRRDIRGYKKPFNSLPSFLSLCNSLLPGRLEMCQLTLHHWQVLGLVGILLRFGLTSPSHSSFISTISLPGVVTLWKDLPFYFILPIFKRPGCAPGWRRANQSLRTGSCEGQPPATGPWCFWARRREAGSLVFPPHSVFSLGFCTLCHLPRVPVLGWS